MSDASPKSAFQIPENFDFNTLICDFGTGSPSHFSYPSAIKAVNEYNERYAYTYSTRSSIDGYLNNRQALLPYFKSIFHPDIELDLNNIIFGSGTESIFSNALRMFKAEGILNSGDVVLRVHPTYGAWAVKPEHENIDAKFEGVITKAENDYRMNAKELESRIIEINDKLKKEYNGSPEQEVPRVKVFLMINPNNPTGTVYTKEEVERFSEIFQKYDIKIIDDLVYRGTEYNQAQLAYPFAAVKGMFDRTLTFTGLSKAFGLPGLRAGVACGPESLIKPLKSQLELHSNLTEGRAQSFALAATFSMESRFKIERREKYLQKQVEKNRFKRELWVGLIDGIGAVSEEYRERIEVEIFRAIPLGNPAAYGYKEYNIDKRKKYEILLEGLPYLKTLGVPESGFFQMIDVSEMKGLSINGSTINTATDIENYFIKEANVGFLAGDKMEWPDEKLVFRSNFSAFHSTKMIEAALALHKILQPLKAKESDEKNNRRQTTVSQSSIVQHPGNLSFSEQVGTYNPQKEYVSTIGVYHVMQDIRNGRSKLQSTWRDAGLPHWMLEIVDSVSISNDLPIDRKDGKKHIGAKLHKLVRSHSAKMLDFVKENARQKEQSSNLALQAMVAIASDLCNILTEVFLDFEHTDHFHSTATEKIKSLTEDDLLKNEKYKGLLSELSPDEQKSAIQLGRQLGRITFMGKSWLKNLKDISPGNIISQPKQEMEEIEEGANFGEFLDETCTLLASLPFHINYGIKAKEITKAVQYTMQPLLILRLAESIRKTSDQSAIDTLDIAINGLRQFPGINDTLTIRSGKDIALLMGCMASHIANDEIKHHIINVVENLANIDNNTELRTYLNSMDVQVAFNQLCHKYFKETQWDSSVLEIERPQWESGEKAIELINEALANPHTIHVGTHDAILAALKPFTPLEIAAVTRDRNLRERVAV